MWQLSALGHITVPRLVLIHQHARIQSGQAKNQRPVYQAWLSNGMAHHQKYVTVQSDTSQESHSTHP